MGKIRVLIVDDEDGIRTAASRWLKKEGYTVRTSPDGQSAVSELVGDEFDVVLCDVRMPELGGFELLDIIRERSLAPVVVMMSAFGDDQASLDAIRKGAYDYLPKPFTRGELLLTIRKAEERERLVKENTTLRDALKTESSFDNIVAGTEVMHQIFRTIRKVADFKSTVLISGESGTGKELVARAIHFGSARAQHPFVPVNCGAIPEQLLESELFGHVRGAFTDATRSKPGLFEEANEGTLFLDEISSLPLSLQVKLLRVLQEGEIRRVGDTKAIPINVRIIAAAMEELSELAAQGEFREDLYYRLNVIPINLPPLRERRDDISLLAEHFLKVLNERLGTQIKGIAPDTMQAFSDYHWPGNVRQLQNIVERAVVLSEGPFIELKDLPPKVRASQMAPAELSPQLESFFSDDLSVKKATRLLERELIRRALEKTAGNRTQASKLLELSHRALLYKMKEYELQDVK